MPTRILRDWTDSTSVETLSPEAERLFVRLIMKADDYGRYHADPRLVLAGCLPLVRQATVNLVIAWLGDLEKAGLITTYAADNGRKYLEINKFGQRTRAEKSKFPDPSTQVVGQVSVKCQTDARQPRSESESDTKSETETDKASDKPPRVTWLTPFGEIWTKHYGGELAYAKASKSLQSVIKAHGTEKALAAWERYCSTVEITYASPAHFSQKTKPYLTEEEPYEGLT